MPHDLRVISYEEVVAGARRHFLRESTIDMEQLAQELAVSRATLYRAVDGRDRCSATFSGASPSGRTSRRAAASPVAVSKPSSRSRTASRRA